MTKKLFYQDAYMNEFEAVVTAIDSLPTGEWYIVLDRTAFYPTGGGQPCDQGTIDGVHVTDVEEVDGAVRHRINEQISTDDIHAMFLIGKSVKCTIDFTRRFDHMQQHCGQHILSASFEERYQIPTIGFHMGEENVTIDLDLAAWDQAVADEVEQYANQIIMENRAITARFVEADELANMPLRKAPSVDENIRIVAIEQFDYNPCGGTHPRSTGEVGLIQIFGWEMMRGKVRVEFACGMRAIRRLQEKKKLLHTTARVLTCGEPDVPSKAERLLQERKELEKRNQLQWVQLVEYETDEWIEHAQVEKEVRIVAKEFHDQPIPVLQKIAQTLTAKASDSIAILKANGEKTQLVLARGEQVELDMNQVLKAVLEAAGGKGGGSPKLAQGGATQPFALADVFATVKSFL